MRLFPSVLILYFSLFLNVYAESVADSLFNDANDFYATGNYTEAIEKYENILNEGLESEEVYYNLGNAYYKTQNYPKSILNYERALLYDPRDEDIVHNLAKARMYIIDSIDEIPVFVIKRWINGLIILFNSNTWALLSLLAFVLGISFLLIYFLSSKLLLRRLGFYSAVLVLIFSGILFYLSYKSRNIIEESNGGIVMTSTVTVKASPRNTGTDLFIIHEGLKVQIIDALDNWYEIRLSDGKQGWMQQKDVEPI